MFDVKPKGKPPQRVCTAVFGLAEQFARLATSTLWHLLLEPALLAQLCDPSAVEWGYELIGMADAADAHKSVMVGKIKHTEVLFKCLQLAPIAHLQGCEILGLLYNAGDSPTFLEPAVNARGGTSEMLRELVAHGASLPEDVDETFLLLIRQHLRKQVGCGAVGDAGDAVDDADDADQSMPRVPVTIFALSQDAAAMAPWMKFGGWSSPLNQPYITMVSVDRIVFCPQTKMLLYAAPCNKSFEMVTELLAKHDGKIPAEYGVSGLPLWSDMLKYGFLSFVHDPHHALATPGRALLALLASVAISSSVRPRGADICGRGLERKIERGAHARFCARAFCKHV